MSEKSISQVIEGARDEDTEAPVQMSVTADYLARDCMYLNIDGRSIAVPVAQIVAAADFIKAEA